MDFLCESIETNQVEVNIVMKRLNLPTEDEGLSDGSEIRCLAAKYVNGVHVVNRLPEDVNSNQLRDKIQEAEKLLEKKNEDKFRIKEILDDKKMIHSRLVSSLWYYLRRKESQLYGKLERMRDELKSLRRLLNQKHFQEKLGRMNQVRSKRKKLLHCRCTSVEEKKLIREIKQIEVEGTRVAPAAAMEWPEYENVWFPVYYEHWYSYEVEKKIEDLVIGISEIRKQHAIAYAELQKAENEKKEIEKEISRLQEQLARINQQKQAVQICIFQLARANMSS